MKILSCRFCNSFWSFSCDEYLQHMQSKHKCPFTECSQKYHNRVGDAFMCNQGTSSLFRSHTCVLCNGSFETTTLYLQHLTTHPTCKVCRYITCTCENKDDTRQNRKRRRPNDAQDDNSEILNSFNQIMITPEYTDRITYKDLQDRYCVRCDIRFLTIDGLKSHLSSLHQEVLEQALREEEVANQVGRGDVVPLDLVSVIFNDSLRTYAADMLNADFHSVDGVFDSLRSQVKQILISAIAEKRLWKVQFTIKVAFFKRHPSGETLYSYPIFTAFLMSIENSGSVAFAYKKARETFKTRISDYVNLNSGWILHQIIGFEMVLSEYKALSAGQNMVLPQILVQKSRCLVNVASDDNLCFKRAVYCHPQLAGNVAGANRRRTLESVRYFEDKINDGRINWEGINFPFAISQVKKFEAQNPTIGLNIILFDNEIEYRTEREEGGDPPVVSDWDRTNYSVKKEICNEIRTKCYPLNICKEERSIMIDILMVMSQEGQHYMFIQSFVGLFRKPGHSTRDICRYCLQSFNDSLSVHIKFCAALGRQQTTYPTPKFLKFRSFGKTQKQPFTIFADFESNLHRIHEMSGQTVRTQHHIPVGFAYIAIDWNNKRVAFNRYRATHANENVVQRFIAELLALVEGFGAQIDEWQRQAKDIMTVTDADLEMFTNPNFRNDNSCIYCYERFGNDERICRDHDHLPPFNFRGFAHNGCNAQARLSKKVSCFFHNLKSYDGLFLVKNAVKDIAQDVDIIALSSEKLMAITLNKNLTFLDSLNFFHASLDKVVASLNQQTDFNLTREFFAEYGDRVELLLRKQSYPYNYFDSIEKFNETELPGRDHFFNELTDTPINIEDYEHARRVWDAFDIENLGGWHDLYVTLDVCLLADAFINMRNMFFQDFGLDCAKYMSLPQLSFDAALKMTKSKCEYIKCPTMFCWLQSSIYGGISTAGNKRAYKANNPYLPDYDAAKPNSFIWYGDMVNMYGKALTSKLPLREFKWVTGEALLKIQTEKERFIETFDFTGDYGYFFEVDLAIPLHLHDYFNAYPPIPVKRTVDLSEMSTAQQDLVDILEIQPSSLKTERLICDFAPKKNYVVHGELLLLWVKLGIKIDLIHRAVSFYQEAWLKEYVDFNTNKRQLATNQLQVQNRKNANNMLYGKLLQNKRKRQNVKVVRSKAEINKWLSKPTAERIILINSNHADDSEDIALVCMRRIGVVLDTPVAVGSTVLALSKSLLQSFFYNYLKPKFPEGKLDLLCSDTDSTIIAVECENIYETFKEDESEYFDMSGYDANHPIWSAFHNSRNRKVPGKMQDEYANCVISHFIILQSKCYAMIYFKDGICMRTGETVFTMHDLKKGKAIPRAALEKQVRFNDYEMCIENCIQTYTTSSSIRSYKHNLYTITQRKRALNSFDLKRWILPDGVNTLAYGHKNIHLYE